VAELETGQVPVERVRQPGGGRRVLTETDPDLTGALLALAEPIQRSGDVSAYDLTS
jgi:hypothetical protein